MEYRKKYLLRISQNISHINPTLSRYYFERAVECALTKPDGEKFRNSLQLSKCLYCYSQLQSNTTNVKLLPKLHHSKQIKHVMKKLGQNQRLDKYQNKLVYDYVNGQNKLLVATCMGSLLNCLQPNSFIRKSHGADEVIKCLLCNKTRTVNGQNRLDRQKQKETMKTERDQLAQQNETTVKSRKVKKKERRKILQQKRKLAENVDEDKNAGLIIPTNYESTDSKFEESKSITESKCEGQDITVGSDEKNTLSSTHKDETCHKNYIETKNTKVNNNKQTNGVQPINIVSNVPMKPSYIKGNSKSRKDGKNLLEVCAQRTFSDKKHTALVGQVKKSTSEKKKKVKNMSQQLGLILKKEKDKQSNSGSLTDFLSTL